MADYFAVIDDFLPELCGFPDAVPAFVDVAGATVPVPRVAMIWHHGGNRYVWSASAPDPTGAQFPGSPPAPITDARVLCELPP